MLQPSAANRARSWRFTSATVAGAVVFAWLVRWALSPLDHEDAAYSAFLIAAIVVTARVGWRGGIAALILGGVVAIANFVDASWVFSLRGRHAWGAMTYLIAGSVGIILVSNIVEARRREREAASRLQIVSREFQHRLKNLLAIVQSLVRQTGRSARTASDFERTLSSRLQALTKAQELLSMTGATSNPLAELIEKILAPFETGDQIAFIFEAPDLATPSKLTVSIALILHELATNAVKYGALSVPEGRVIISARRCGAAVVLNWKELGGPVVAPPKASGFGTRLINSAIKAEGGDAELAFEPDGVRCAIRTPPLAPGEIDP